tara:strand:- start:804 stop:971 length:168 start_codon:yes stop_codon:yes gene_type:complete
MHPAQDTPEYDMCMYEKEHFPERFDENGRKINKVYERDYNEQDQNKVADVETVKP